MLSTRVIRKQNEIFELFNSFYEGDIENGFVFSNNSIIGSLTFCKDDIIHPVLIKNNSDLIYDRNEKLHIKCFHDNLEVQFESSLLSYEDINKRERLAIPDKITVIQKRTSSRYKVNEEEGIKFLTPLKNHKVVIYDIGINGIGLIAKNTFGDIGDTIYCCKIKTLTLEFHINCTICNKKELSNNKWRIGIGLSFPDRNEQLRYIEWMYYLLNKEPNSSKDIITSSLIESYKYVQNSLSLDNKSRDNAIQHELLDINKQFNISPLHCNIAIVKNNKLYSACSAKRIYLNTFCIQRLLIIPGLHLYNSPKILIYLRLTEFLAYHPSFRYLIIYKDRDIDWHRSFFSNFLAHCSSQEKCEYEKLAFIEVKIESKVDVNINSIHDNLSWELIESGKELKKIIKNLESHLALKAYDFLKPNKIDQFCEILGSTNNSMIRKTYKIKRSGKIICVAVVEVYPQHFCSDQSLDTCRLYFTSNKNDLREIVDFVQKKASLIFFSFGKKKMRVIWANNKADKIHKKVKNEIYRGELLRLILSREGLTLLNQHLKLFKQHYSNYFHLTFPQHNILQYEKLFPNTSINTIACTISFNEEVNLEYLKRAIKFVIKKYDSLRIRIINRHGRACQIVVPYDKCNIKVAKINLKGHKNEKNFHKDEEQWISKPISIYNSPLYEFCLFKKRCNLGGYFIKGHHIVTDAWSIGLIANAIKDSYYSIKKGLKVISSPNYSYLDFLEKELSYKYSWRMKKNREYWINNLEGLAESNRLVNYKDLLINSRSKRESFILKGKQAKKIKDFINDRNITLLSFFLSCYYIYFYKSLNIKDLIIGTAILNREGAQERATTGLFVSAQPVRMKINEENSFLEFANKLSRVFRRVLKNQKYPISLIQKELHKSGVKNAKLYDITFTYQNFKLDPEFSLKWHPYNHQSEALNIHINDWENKGHFIVDYDFQLELYSKSQIDFIQNHLLRIIDQIIEKPKLKIRQIKLLDENQTNSILIDFNPTQSKVEEDDICSLFEKQVSKNPSKLAVKELHQGISYHELNTISNKLARFICSTVSKKKENFIGVLIEKTKLQTIALLGILKSGNAFVPLDFSAPKERIKHIIQDANIKLVIAESSFNSLTSSLLWECNTLNEIMFLDTKKTYMPEDYSKMPLMSKELWCQIGKKARNYITAGGWINSYTGQPFTIEEMEEFGDNALLKLKKYVKSSSSVLEIGCASGITMYRISPLVKKYHGTDISEVVLKKNRKIIKNRNIKNISLSKLAAHEIKKIRNENYNVVILNSVIQAFPGVNYLRNVIKDIIKLCKTKAVIFIGDIMDYEKKGELIDSINSYGIKDKKLKNNLVFELFVRKGFFKYLKNECDQIEKIEITKKIHTIENELTRFRYDVLIHINKRKKNVIKPNNTVKCEYGYDELDKYKSNNLNINGMNHKAAYLLYTSGTSGKPKGIIIEHKSVVNLCGWYKKEYGISNEDIIGRLIPYTFDPSIAETFSALLYGATLLFIPNIVRLSPKMLNDYFNENKVSVSSMPFSYYRYFKKCQNISLRLLIVGGEKFIDYKKNKYKVYNNYGPTENTVLTTSYFIKKKMNEYPIGKPIANTQVYILDKHNNLMPIGIPGEICIAGAGLARGYINDEGKDKFVENPFEPGKRMYRSGDIGKWLPDGNIEFIGREDDQVKIRGFRIELKEVETVLNQCRGVNSGAVILKEFEKGDKTLWAFYEENKSITKEEITSYLCDHLPYYMVPSEIIALPIVPLLSSGKIDRQTLIKYELNELDPNHLREIQQPTTEIENCIHTIMSKELERTIISIDDNFFDIGGDSLSAVSTMSQVSHALKMEIYVNTLYAHPTIRSLAKEIEHLRTTKWKGVKEKVTHKKEVVKKSKFVKAYSTSLLKKVQQKKIGAVKAAALAYIPSDLPSQMGMNKEDIRSRFFENKPMLFSVMELNKGTIGLIVIPVFGDEIFSKKKQFLKYALEGIKLSERIGAEVISLTGLIPSVTNYGLAIQEAIDKTNPRQVTTGHATTSASVVMSIERMAKLAGRKLYQERVSFIGLGSIGLGTLHLLLETLPKPKELILCDLYSKKNAIEKVKKEIAAHYLDSDRISIVTSRSSKQIAKKIYDTDIIIGATSVPNILEIDKVKPGTLLIDDSAPHCFCPEEAIKRFEKRGDILFTEGGFLRSPEPINKMIYQPPGFGVKVPMMEQDPFNITGCILSSLLTASFKHIEPTVGIIDVATSMKHYKLLKKLKFKSADLHCWQESSQKPYVLDEKRIKVFKERFNKR